MPGCLPVTVSHSAGASNSSNRFRVLRPHARGGLGQVYVAQDEELSREVALKEIQEEHAHHPQSRARFLLEAEVTGGLEHPGIVPVYSLGSYADGRPFYVMRFIRGDSLKEAIKRFRSENPAARKAGSLDGEQLVEFRKLLGRFVDVCQAIAYAHSRGVLHRDLKPGNIMLGKFGETLIVDWGLAKTLDKPETPSSSSTDRQGTELPLRPSSASSAETMAGSALGTPAYMSPEQAEGRLDLLGPASDVYSLGATLYHLLTGEAPFSGQDMGSILAKVRRGEFVLPHKLQPTISRGLEAICLKAMALKPEDRYASAKDLAEDVEHWLADEPVSAWPEPWTVTARRWAGRHRTLVASAAAVLVVATAALVVGNLLLAQANAETQEANEKLALSEKESRELAAKEAKARVVAEKAYKQEEKARQVAEAFVYNATIREASGHYNSGDFVALRAALDETPPERRGPDYGFLARQHAKVYRLPKTHTSTVTSLALSPDGKRLHSGSLDKTVKVWDLEAGKELMSLSGHTLGVQCLALGADGKRLVSAGSGSETPSEIKVWDLEAGKEVMTLKGFSSQVTSLALSADGKRLVLGGGVRGKRGEIQVWDLELGKEEMSLEGHKSQVTTLGLSADGKRLASASQGLPIPKGEIKVWDLETGTEIKGPTNKYLSEVDGLSLSSDGKRLAWSKWALFTVWDLEAGNLMKKDAAGRNDSLSPVVGRKFYSDGKWHFMGRPDGTVTVWDYEASKEILSLRGHAGRLMSLAVSSDGRRLVTGGGDSDGAGGAGEIRVWELDRDRLTSRNPMRVRGYTTAVKYKNGILAMALSANGKRLYSINSGATISVWDLESGKEVMTLRGEGEFLPTLAISPDWKRLYSGGRGKVINVWDLQTGQEVMSLKGHTGTIYGVALSPDGRRLYSGSGDKTIRVWDVDAGKEISILALEKGSVWSVVISSDGKRLFSGSEERGNAGQIKVWDLESGKEIMTLPGTRTTTLDLVPSPGGKRLFVASDMTIRVWNVETGKELMILRGHTGPISSLALSTDGRWLYSGSKDETIRTWDLDTGKEALSFYAHRMLVGSLALSPDGKRLYSRGLDDMIKLWDLGAGE